MDAHLFRRFCDLSRPLLTGCRVEKLQEPAPNVLVISVYGAGGKKQLCLHFGRKNPFCFLTARSISAGHAPSAEVMRLRKYAVGRRIVACTVQWCARRLWLMLGGVPRDNGVDSRGEDVLLPWLLLDLRNGAELRFLPQCACPEEENPVWPEPQELAAALEHWRQWPVLTPALRRCCAHLPKEEQWALLEDLRVGGGDVFCYGPTRNGQLESVRLVSAWPLPLPLWAGLREQGDTTDMAEMCAADVLATIERGGQDMVLTRMAQDAARAAATPFVRRRRKLLSLLDKLREEEQRLRIMTQGQADAIALQENLWRWPPDLRAASVHVEQGEHGSARDIALDKCHTVREAMAVLFHRARRGRRGLEHVAQRRAVLEGELAEIDQRLQVGGAFLPGAGSAAAAGPLPAAGAGCPKNVQIFVSSDGFVLLRGRDAKGNLAARRLAAGHDIWLHAENGPGAHVIIRRAHGGQNVPERTLDEAGSLAALKSWQKDALRARIQYAEVRHVKPMRNAPAGTVRIDKALPSREVPVDASLEERLLPR
ncbi:MAG: DUF814 domain-containing protein [Desulfovibrio sp.]|nr:DUF814 domain-containing protein [Desulfovibrio sp.]